MSNLANLLCLSISKKCFKDCWISYAKRFIAQSVGVNVENASLGTKVINYCGFVWENSEYIYFPLIHGPVKNHVLWIHPIVSEGKNLSQESAVYLDKAYKDRKKAKTI